MGKHWPQGHFPLTTGTYALGTFLAFAIPLLIVLLLALEAQ